MPETEEIKKDLVDVGEEEGAEINLDEKGNPEKPEVIQEEEIEVEQVKEEPVKVKVEEKTEKKEELEQYSEGVQKRIAKLTRKMREAERQKEEALTYAQSVKSQKEHVEKESSFENVGDRRHLLLAHEAYDFQITERGGFFGVGPPLRKQPQQYVSVSIVVDRRVATHARREKTTQEKKRSDTGATNTQQHSRPMP